MGRRRKEQTPTSDDDSDGRPRYGANARERDRMRVLSKAFSKLKTTLPWVPPDTKLSKLDTLRLATCYIAHLRQILTEEDDITTKSGDITCFNNNVSDMHINTRCDVPPINTRNDARTLESGYVHPLNLTWPYSFNKHATSTNDQQKPLTSHVSNRLGDLALMSGGSQTLTTQEIITS